MVFLHLIGVREPVSQPELEALLRPPRPMIGAAIGLGGLALLTWLMVLKPF
jgi:hypothetical protein